MSFATHVCLTFVNAMFLLDPQQMDTLNNHQSC